MTTCYISEERKRKKKKKKQPSCVGPPEAQPVKIRINSVTAWNSDNWSIYELVNLQPWVWGRPLIIHIEIRRGNLKFIYQQLHSPQNPITVQWLLVQNLSSTRLVIENISSCWKGLSEKCTPVFKAVRGGCWAQGWSCRPGTVHGMCSHGVGQGLTKGSTRRCLAPSLAAVVHNTWQHLGAYIQSSANSST